MFFTFPVLQVSFLELEFRSAGAAEHLHLASVVETSGPNRSEVRPESSLGGPAADVVSTWNRPRIYLLFVHSRCFISKTMIKLAPSRCFRSKTIVKLKSLHFFLSKIIIKVLHFRFSLRILCGRLSSLPPKKNFLSPAGWSCR